MSETMNGFATIKGIGASGCTVEIGGYASVFLESLPVQLTADMTEMAGADGQGTCAIQWTNKRVILEVTFRPGSTETQTLAQAEAFLIDQGATVTLSGFKIVKILGSGVARESNLLNGDWLHIGPSTTLTLNASTPGEVQLTLAYYFERHSVLLNQVAV